MISSFEYHSHLGFHNPYYISENGRFTISKNLSFLLKKLNKKELDFTAIVQILALGYPLGDRTLIKGVQRTPWMARPNESLTDWVFYDLPKHKENTENEFKISQQLYSILKEEMYEYVKNHSTIGILLTGGMDSRIIACVLNEMITRREIRGKSVVAYTWGNEYSRDVVYSKQIANLLNWDWQHLTVDKNQMLLNFNITVDLGCEFAPTHLHALSKVAQSEDVDCVLAGSFGDSIGRGEYSGIKIKQLKDIKTNIKNVAGLLRGDYKKLTAKEITSDLDKYHNLFPENLHYQQNEQDQQLNYMRRMLNPCMSIVNNNIPLYQMFTSPNVFGYMWSIKPELRNDNIYKNILEYNNKNLLKIPWARTGLKFPLKTGIPDRYIKNHHNYGKMIREEFLDIIQQKFNDTDLKEMNIFNMNSIERLIYYVKTKPINNSSFYEEKLLWIAAVAEFVNKNKLNINLSVDRSPIEPLFKSLTEYNSKYLYKKFYQRYN